MGTGRPLCHARELGPYPAGHGEPWKDWSQRVPQSVPRPQSQTYSASPEVKTKIVKAIEDQKLLRAPSKREGISQASGTDETGRRPPAPSPYTPVEGRRLDGFSKSYTFSFFFAPHQKEETALSFPKPVAHPRRSVPAASGIFLEVALRTLG